MHEHMSTHPGKKEVSALLKGSYAGKEKGSRNLFLSPPPL